MKTLWKAIKVTLAFCAVFAIGYVGVLWLMAHVTAPGKGTMQTVVHNGEIVGVERMGQAFAKDRYFWGRPSATGGTYDATRSGGSNQGPTHAQYLADTEARIDTFLQYHPYLNRNDVPAELVTVSGSGFDPDISPAAAYVQVRRVADARGVEELRVQQVVDNCITRPVLNLFGPARVSVLKLNVELDKALAKK